jgi:hypothetical protein
MPAVSRRRLLGGSVAVAAAAYGTHRLYRGATGASFASWSPAPGTWPLRRYDPANTAHSPGARPPRSTPSVRELASTPTPGGQPRHTPLVGPDGIVVHGTGLAAYPHDGAPATRVDGTATPLAGFGPDGRLRAVREEAGGPDPPSTLVVYDADLRERRRTPLGTDNAVGLTVGAGETHVGHEDGTLRGVANRGGREWQVDGALPALAGGRLYAADAPLDGTVAYEPRTGLDRRLTSGPARRWSAGPVDAFPSPPAVADGRVVVGSRSESGGVVAAVDAATGDRLWEPRALGRDVATPALVGDRGYVAVGTGSLDTGLVVALDLATGETRWRDGLDWHATEAAVGGGVLVVVGTVRTDGERTGGRVRAYDRATGDALWDAETAVPHGLALVDDRVLVTAGTGLYELA